MESIARLAGGVAHDFNNILGVIMGHAEMALLNVSPEEPVHNDLKQILKAARRSADLTRQLLAFARKQTVSPRILDLNDTIEGMLKMLRRLVGEHIELRWIPGPGLWSVKIDPSQVDQMLANLVVNSRDAIAGVGAITVQTENVTLDEAYCRSHEGFKPGEYVLLSVSDNGIGMDKETLARVFEPFFTTKEVGKGTGLGLATVYGVVKQNEGFINAYSEPGQGTTFKIYLPRVQAVSSPKPEAVEERPLKGAETVLLVEDEEAILGLAQAILEQQGYTVLAARTPGEALELAERYAGVIQLLIADVVMPQMNGRELYKNVSALRPEIKVLFMSGYTANVIAHHGVLEEGVQFLEKPFTVRGLAEKVREVLDRKE
jgi:CheY-like chemotaxis protein